MEFEVDPAIATKGADLVIMAVPVGAVGKLAEQIIPHMKSGAVLTETGSTKTSVLRDVSPHLREDIHWLPSHPLAGTEHSGPGAGFESLFDGRYWIVLPLDCDEMVVAKFETFVTGLGSITERMQADYHDKVLALSSHLPHLISYSLVLTALKKENSLKSKLVKFSAGGFRDFTRVAGSDPEMWRDIFLANNKEIQKLTNKFIKELHTFSNNLESKNSIKLLEKLKKTKKVRERIVKARQAGKFIPND